MKRRFLLGVAIALTTGTTLSHAQTPVDTGWTYQGRLTQSGSPATGSFDLRFSLFLDDQATIPTGPVLNVPGVAVVSGLFTAKLDFGAQFTGYKNWLQVEVSPAGAGTYTALPLQEITSAPQSLFSQLPWATDANANISFVGGKVGIGRSPEFGLDVSSSIIRLGLDANGGGQLVLANNAGDNRIYMEAYDTNGTASASELLITGWHGQALPKLTISASTTSFLSGLVGIGTTTPNAKLHVYDPNSVTHLVETGGGTNAWAKTVYRNLNGGWEVGTSRGFNGDSFYIYRSGNATIGLAVTPGGQTQVHTLQILGGSDLAEPFDVAVSSGGQDVQPGMVVVIDPANPGDLRMSDRPYDGKVAGVISGANGLQPGMVMSAKGENKADGKHPVAMTGRVWVYVDASFGAVQPGDLLTTSSTPGHAMLASDHGRAFGAVIGKAMTELKEGKGLVLVLVNLQ